MLYIRVSVTPTSHAKDDTAGRRYTQSSHFLVSFEAVTLGAGLWLPAQPGGRRSVCCLCGSVCSTHCLWAAVCRCEPFAGAKGTALPSVSEERRADMRAEEVEKRNRKQMGEEIS